jgi:hypothetical protein
MGLKIRVLKKRYTVMTILITAISSAFIWFVFARAKFGMNDGMHGLIALFILLYSGCLVKYIWDQIFGIYSHVFLIDEEGVAYQKRKATYRLSWGEIRDIYIYPNAYGRLNKSSMVCFIVGPEHPLRLQGVKQFDERFFGVQYRDKIIQEIRKYWDGPIQGIYQVNGKSI